jgi:flagellar assembly protein FliH
MMTSSSTDPTVVRGLDGTTVRTLSLDTDLRSGAWTRLGDTTVLGDIATESTLHGLAESTRAAARAQGYAVGWAEGRRAGEEHARAEAGRETAEWAAEHADRAAEHEHALEALRQAAQRLERTVAEVCTAVETHSVEVALQLAEAIVGREVALAADPAADAMRRALALVPEGTAVTVRLHPADRSSLDAAEFAEYAVRLADDPTLARGDAAVDTDKSVVDATVAAALARVREVLAP